MLRPRRSIFAADMIMIPSASKGDAGEASQQRPPLLVTRSKHRRPSRATPLYAQPPTTATASANEDERQKQEFAPSTIAEMIEVSFLQSCLQLSQGYVDVLKLFIVAVKAGYEFPVPLDELHRLVETCPVNSAGRELMREEKELRFEWMKLVYEMLNALKQQTEAKDGADGSSISGISSDGGESDVADLRISAVVETMLSIQNELGKEEELTGGEKDATVGLTNLTVDEALKRSPSLQELNESLTSDPMGKAFLTNDVRVGLMTFRVLEEEKICMEGASGSTNTGQSEFEGGGVPRPPIPGT